MAVKSYEEYLKEVEKSMSAQKEADKLASDKSYDTQKQLTTNTYNKQIDETADSYQDLYDENAVQRIINERAISENMANLGLTDSGLNRTQQTAVQLSYGNAKNKLDMNRQKAVDSLAAELASKISQLDTEKQSAAASIDSSYAQAARSSAQDMYNTAFKAEQEQIAATNKAYYSALKKSYTSNAKAQEKDNILYTYMGDDSVEKGKKVFRDSNGKTYSIDEGVNPYTGDNNLKSAAAAKKYGLFSNGYQPKGIIGYGTLTAVGTTYIFGKKQNIWKTADGTYWVWNGKANEYQQADIGE